MPEYPPDLAALRARSQDLLVQFLETELSLGFTFLATATEAGDDLAHVGSALSKAHAALDSIRAFQGRIKDPGTWKRIQDRVDDLQSNIEAFEKFTASMQISGDTLARSL